jgi:hypothetical protein
MNHARIELSLSDALIDFVIYPTSTCHVPWEMDPIPECAVRGTIKVQLIAGLVPDNACDSLPVVYIATFVESAPEYPRSIDYEVITQCTTYGISTVSPPSASIPAAAAKWATLLTTSCLVAGDFL